MPLHTSDAGLERLKLGVTQKPPLCGLAFIVLETTTHTYKEGKHQPSILQR